MGTIKALLWAMGVTTASGIALTIAKGVPTLEQVLIGGISMFVVAFAAMKIWGDDEKQNNGQDNKVQ